MKYPQNGGANFEVYCSGVVAQSIRQAHQRAAQQGRGPAMLEAFRQAVEKLGRNPNRFGEALYILPALRMQVRTAVIRPIAIDFRRLHGWAPRFHQGRYAALCVRNKIIA